MEVQHLQPLFGARVTGVDLKAIVAAGPDGSWRAIRDLFERRSLLVFPDQWIDDETHLAINRLFGPIEVRSQDDPKPEPTVSMLSNVLPDGSLMPPTAARIRDMRANQLWHTDSTFLPWPALVNVLRADVVPASGGETEWATTRAALRDMPAAMAAALRDAVILHRYSHSRSKVGDDVASAAHVAMWPDTAWNAIWRNPVTGEDAVYIASHAFGIRGWSEAEAQAFIDEVIAFCTQPQYTYAHTYAPGDVVLWDERATVHRGMPWDLNEARTLRSACSTATDVDGLASVTPKAA